ncbi:AzlD domain-containing protein [Rhodoplanes roseus]|uniref:Branched-chain amino acid transport n=1 Tax=Rhodoplanes roseus TaxID=29409 RepID=A0A327KXV8_9BRAD|nr:AzlD domain-containing protein [Rhodoplanes roseus]RAI42884.1 branched-chain amino acid transport [Rhodoplanes roseus]
MAELWPYLVLVLVGFLPNEMWRWLGVVFSRGLDETSEALIWVRAVATAILTGVVAKIIVFAPGALAGVPLWMRLGATVVGMLAFLLARQSVFAGVVTGTLALIALDVLVGR